MTEESVHTVLNSESRQMLLICELMFKLVATTVGHSGLGYSIVGWDFGKHTLTREDLSLTPEERSIASSALEHCTTYIIALELDTILSLNINDRFKHEDKLIRSACWIARLIRNAFSHNPLQPEWKTYPECDGKKYVVPGIIELETTGLHGKLVDRMDYGGPIAMLKLSEFVRRSILRPPGNQFRPAQEAAGGRTASEF